MSAKENREIPQENYPNQDRARKAIGMEFHRCICGREVVAFHKRSGMWMVVCPECEIRTADHAELEEARRAWNKVFEKEIPIEYIAVPSKAAYGCSKRYADLKAGESFRFYKDLAYRLGEGWPKGEASRKRLKETWSCYFNWTWDERHRIEITEVYEQPKLKARVSSPRRKSPVYRKGQYRARKEGREKEYREEIFREMREREKQD